MTYTHRLTLIVCAYPRRITYHCPILAAMVNRHNRALSYAVKAGTYNTRATFGA
jgi:hypothetical protein